MAHAPDADDADAFFLVVWPLLPSVWHLRLRLQHLRQRLGRIGELAGVDRNAPLDQPAGGGDVALRIDAHGIG